MENNTNIEPTPALAASSQTNIQTPIKSNRSPRFIFGAIIAIAIIILGGGAALAYTMYYQNPDKVVHDAIINALQAQTMSTKGTVSYRDNGVNVDLILSSKSTKSEGEFGINAKVTLDSEGIKQEFEADGLGKFVGEILYFKLNGVTEIAEDAMNNSQSPVPLYAVEIIEKIDKRWISLKISDYQDFYESIGRQQACFSDLSEKFKSDTSAFDEILKLYSKNRIVTVKDKLGSKSIDGTSSLGYQISIDQNATVSFVRGLENTKLGNELKKCDESIDYDTLAEDLAVQTVESKHVAEVELWVSRFGHEITKLSFYGETSDSGQLTIALRPVFNQAVIIEAPVDAVPFESVMAEIRAVVNEYTATEPQFDTSIMPINPDHYSEFDYSSV